MQRSPYHCAGGISSIATEIEAKFRNNSDRLRGGISRSWIIVADPERWGRRSADPLFFFFFMKLDGLYFGNNDFNYVFQR